MKKMIMVAAFAVVLSLLAGCAADAKNYHRDFPVKNPTSWVFPYPLAELRVKTLEAFSLEHQITHPVPLTFTPPLMNTLYVSTVEREEKDGTLWATFKDRNDIHLNDLRSTLWQSMVYGGKKITASFEIHFEPVGEKETRVTVTAIDPKVIDGIDCCGPHGPYARYVSVSPSTFEEYTILLYLGQYLGADMPRIVLPH